MALKVWLPLSSNTTNYGLSDDVSDFSIAGSGLWYFDANGILGGQAFVSGADVRVFGQFTSSLSKVTISAWVKEGNGNSTGASILAVQNGTTEVLVLQKTATGYAIPQLVDEDLFTLASGWNHIAVTADGTKVKAYLNGALVKDVAQTGTIAAASAKYSLTIGGKVATETTENEVTTRTFGSVWIGTICAVKVSDSVASQFEIVNEANGLVINYSFNGKVSLGTGVDLPQGTTAADFGFGDKEHDLSGNEYDAPFGTVQPVSSSDTPMYSASYDFTEADAILTPAIRMQEFASRYTLSVWAKGSGTIATVGSGTPITGASDISNWHHIVITSAGKKYVDGVENGTLSGAITAGFNKVSIGGSFTGKLSDFRIYAVEMSAEQIANLYSRKAAIDNSGKLIAAEFIVDDENIEKPGFNKKGIVSAAEMGNWTGESDNPSYITSFSITAETGAVNVTDVLEI